MSRISIRLSEVTLSTLFKMYNTNSETIAIKNCLVDAINTQTLTGGKSKRRLTPSQTLARVKKEKHTTSTPCSVRIGDDIIAHLKNYYSTESISEAIRCAIYDVIHSTGKELCIKPHNKIIYMIGQKNADMVQWLNHIFDEATSTYALTSYLEPFVGTANVLLHTDAGTNETINDFSYDLINLHRVIKNYPTEFKLCLLHPSMTSNIKGNFEKFIKSLNTTSIPKRRNKELELKRAVAFYYTRYFSHYGDGTHVNKNKDIQNYKSNLDYIWLFSQRLRNTAIKKGDAIYRLSTYIGKSNSLIYIDAPYINTEDYYNINQTDKKRKVFKNHFFLRNKVEKLRINNVCLLSYRTTASASALKKNKEAENVIKATLDELYLGRGYYYALHKLKKGQIEILISTHPLSGFIAYETSLISREVAYHG